MALSNLNMYISTVLICGLFSVKVLIGSVFSHEFDSKPCIRRTFNYDSVVCVCNSTYCDTLWVPSLTPKYGQFDAFVSSRSGFRFKYRQGSFNKKAENVDFSFTVGNVTRQSLMGFGGAFTDAATLTISKLSDNAKHNLINSYFSESGIEYTMGRIPMASCDFSERIYSYDDIEGDLGLKYFKLQKEDTQLKIPLIRDAMIASKRNISLFGSPWSSPGWMKTNNNMTGEGTIKGRPGEAYYKSWAQYFVKFIQAYEKQRIPIWGLTAQNEPIDGLIPKFPFQCLGWTPEIQRDFIAKDLGPALENAGYGHVKLMILDDQRFLLPFWADVVLGDPLAAKYISGIAVHWYFDLVTPSFFLDDTYNKFGDKYFILNSEACEQDNVNKTNSVQLGNWFRGERYFRDILQDLRHGVSGWVDWNIALDMTGGPNWENNRADSPVIVNSDKDEFYKQPMFYAMGHYSKFVLPGSRVLSYSSNLSSNANLDAIFFLRNDNSIVANFINFGAKMLTVSIEDSVLKSGTLNFDIPDRSFVTLVWYRS